MVSFFLVFLGVKGVNHFLTSVLLFSSFVMCLLTQSRTTLIALLVGYFVFQLFTIGVKNLAKKFFLTLAAGIATYILLNQFNFGYIRSIWEVSLSENTSWLVRLEIWQYLYNMIEMSFWFGYGPNKEFFYANNIHPENEYLLMSWRYGVVGLILYLMWVILPFIFACKIARGSEVVWSKVLVMMTPVVLITAIMNAPMSDPRLMLIYAAISGLMFAEYKNAMNRGNISSR